MVTATEITIRGEKIKRLISRLNAKNLAYLRALPKLVDFAERQEFISDEVEKYLREEFAAYDFKDFSSIVLGCTHFNYFKDTMKKILPAHMKILDGNAGTLNQLVRLAKLNVGEGKKNPPVEYFYSGRRVTTRDELARLENYLRRLDEMDLI